MDCRLNINRRWRSGLTLIEIMVVVALMALMMTAAAFGTGIIGRVDVRGEALRFSSSVRYTFNLAATSNKTLQMKIHLREQEFEVEELQLTGGLSQDQLRGVTASNMDSWAQMRDTKRVDGVDEEDKKFGSFKRTKLDEMFISGDDAKLKEGVYFLGLMTSHHDDIQEEDLGTINFFSNGFVERSVVYIGDEAALNGADNGLVYTITISPLTGNSSVVAGRQEISSSFFEEEEDI